MPRPIKDPQDPSYGILESRLRLKASLVLANIGLTEYGELRSEGKVTLKQLQASMAQAKQKFAFTAMLPELQLRVLEMMTYEDLKVFERTNLPMRQLVANRTSVLDATLFRSRLGAPGSVHTRNRQAGKETNPDGARIRLHPIITQLKGLFNRFPEPVFRRKGYGGQVMRDLEELWEYNNGENATEPPTSEIQLSYSSYRPLRQEPGDATKPFPRRVYIIQGSKDAQGVAQPITLEQFVNGHCEALQLEPDFVDGDVTALNWSFCRWGTKFIDERGCLHLKDAVWSQVFSEYICTYTDSDGIDSSQSEAEAEEEENGEAED